MRSISDRLREWWRVHYAERGFGILEPGHQKQFDRDERTAFGPAWYQLNVAYPRAEAPEFRWYVVYRGIPYVARTWDEAMSVAQRIVRAYRLQEVYRPQVHALHSSPRPLFRAKRHAGAEAQKA